MAPAIDKEEVTRIIKLVSSVGHEEAALPETQTSPRRTSVDSNAPFIVIPIPLMPPSQHNPLDDSPQNQDELGLGNKFRNFYLSESHDQGNSRGSKTASSSSSPSHVLVDKITRVLSTLQENRKIPDLAAVTSDLTSQEAILAIKVLPHIGFENDERVMDALNCLRRRIDSSKEDLAIGELTINNAPVVPELPKLAAPFERVGSNFTITIVESEIDGAGKGLTVKEAVPANTVVFAIGKPTIHVITSSKKDLSVSCEHCLEDLSVAIIGGFGSSTCSSASFDTSSDDEQYEEPVEKLSCPGCKMFFYCAGKNSDKKCIENAWNEYHKYECQVFQRILNLEKEKHIEGPTMLLDPDYRGMIRLVSLRYGGEIDDEEWRRIQGLLITVNESSNYHEKIKVIVRGITQEAKILATGPEAELTVEEIENLFRKMEQNRMEMLIPLPKKTDDDPPSFVNVGYIVDAFAAMLNHSCEPNVTWHCEGRELRIVATRDIQPGEELLMSYIEDRDMRKEKLWAWWGIECSCKLCTGED